MSQWLTISRVAHLLGISRVALQKRIREGELPSFDGMVTVDDVQRSWPQLETVKVSPLTGRFLFSLLCSTISRRSERVISR